MVSDNKMEFIAKSCGRIVERHPDDGSADTASEVLSCIRAGWAVTYRKAGIKKGRASHADERNA